jgi:RPA family protein
MERQVARKVRISDILSGSYVRVEGDWEPNYIKAADGTVFSRVNIIATVCQEPSDGMAMIDDGTGQIMLRSFDRPLQRCALGDTILVIGRPREYNGERYLMPEIIKRIEEKGWIEYRNRELKRPAPMSLFDRAIAAIKSLDSGAGADTDSVIKALNDNGAEKLIESLLKEGEIFELSPGRLKLIE